MKQTVTTAGLSLTSTGTAVTQPIPLDSSGNLPKFVRVTSTAAAYVRISPSGASATANDVLVQPADAVTLCAAGTKWVSAVADSGTAKISIVPLEAGSWGYAPNVAPFELNFAAYQTMPASVTFTRASSATRINASGQIETVSSNVPRFDYNPVTLACRGLLCEEARTNLLLNSLIDGSNLGTQSVTVTAQAYTLSFYGTGTVSLSGAYTGSLVGSGAYPTRSTLTFTPSAGALTLTVSGTVQFANLEAGVLATSFIPTAGATATRAADVASMTGGNFSSWYNQSEGTFVVNIDTHDAETPLSQVFLEARADASNALAMYIQVTDGFLANNCVVGGVAQAQLGVVDLADGQKTLTNAFAYKANDFAGVYNGNAAVIDTSGSLPSPSALYIGNRGDGLRPLNGHIARLAYYPARLSNANLQSLSA